MQIEIYADVVFLINIFMDFFIIWMTAKLSRKKVSRIRILAGAAISALLYCTMIFIYPFNIYLNIFSGAFILAAGVFIALKPRSLKELSKYIIIAYISAFAVGGAGIALFYFTPVGGTIGNFIALNINNFSYKILIASTCLCYIIIKLVSVTINRSLISKQKINSIKIYFHNNSVSISTLIDTGNTLYEPISDLPVIIAEFESIRKILPDKVATLFLEHNEDDLELVLMSVKDTVFSGRIRMIPFSSLGRRNGMLIGFKPDKIEINGSEDGIVIHNAVIGICNLKLSQSGEYQALSNPEIYKSK